MVDRRYAIRGIPNDAKHKAALAAIVPDGYKIRRRGRGYRFGDRRYHHSLPLSLAATFTQYCEQPTEWGQRTGAWYAILQWEFRGFKGDKPIIRAYSDKLQELGL